MPPNPDFGRYGFQGDYMSSQMVCKRLSIYFDDVWLLNHSQHPRVASKVSEPIWYNTELPIPTPMVELVVNMGLESHWIRHEQNPPGHPLAMVATAL